MRSLGQQTSLLLAATGCLRSGSRCRQRLSDAALHGRARNGDNRGGRGLPPLHGSQPDVATKLIVTAVNATVAATAWGSRPRRKPKGIRRKRPVQGRRKVAPDTSSVNVEM